MYRFAQIVSVIVSVCYHPLSFSQCFPSCDIPTPPNILGMAAAETIAGNATLDFPTIFLVINCCTGKTAKYDLPHCDGGVVQPVSLAVTYSGQVSLFHVEANCLAGENYDLNEFEITSVQKLTKQLFNP